MNWFKQLKAEVEIELKFLWFWYQLSSLNWKGGELWVSQNFSRISRVSQSRFLAVMCVWQCRFFLYEGVSIFCKAKDLEVPIRLFVCLF